MSMHNFIHKNKLISPRFKPVLKLSLLIFVSLLAFGALKSQRAYAFNPDPDGNIPTDIRQVLQDCIDGPDIGPGYIGWISAAGSPTTTVINVPYGTTSIQLQDNQAGVV